MYGLGAICDSLVFATSPVGLLWCGFPKAGQDAERVAANIKAGAPSSTVLWNTAFGGSGEPSTPPPACEGAFLNDYGEWECPKSTNVMLWVGLAAVGMFAMVALGGGRRRYSR